MKGRLTKAEETTSQESGKSKYRGSDVGMFLHFKVKQDYRYKQTSGQEGKYLLTEETGRQLMMRILVLEEREWQESS